MNCQRCCKRLNLTPVSHGGRRSTERLDARPPGSAPGRRYQAAPRTSNRAHLAGQRAAPRFMQYLPQPVIRQPLGEVPIRRSAALRPPRPKLLLDLAFARQPVLRVPHRPAHAQPGTRGPEGEPDPTAAMPQELRAARDIVGTGPQHETQAGAQGAGRHDGLGSVHRPRRPGWSHRQDRVGPESKTARRVRAACEVV